MNKPKKLDPDKLKVGDLFRGKYWRYGENHIFKEYDKETGKKGLVTSLCNRWFYPDFIHKPRSEKDRLCVHCYNYKQKGILDKIKKEQK